MKIFADTILTLLMTVINEETNINQKRFVLWPMCPPSVDLFFFFNVCMLEQRFSCVFVLSRQLDTQCAIFGTNGSTAINRLASHTMWNFRSFACSGTGNEKQPYTCLQVDIPCSLSSSLWIPHTYIHLYLSLSVSLFLVLNHKKKTLTSLLPAHLLSRTDAPITVSPSWKV